MTGERNKGGKPVVWTEERKEQVFDEIIDRMCEGELISEILRGENRTEGYPNYATFIRWIKESDELGDKYACAREIQAEIELDEIRKIADEPMIITLRDVTRDSDGKETVKLTQVDNVARSKQMGDARRFRLGKMASKYNDKVTLDVNKNLSVTIVVEEDNGDDEDDVEE